MKCTICGQGIFATRSKKSKNFYCSKKCYDSRNPNKHKKCTICEKDFISPRRKTTKKPYCSKECYFLRNGGKNKNCEICKIELMKHSSTYSKYCKKCYIKIYSQLPENKDKSKKYYRNRYRIKKDIPLDAPLQYAEKGKGFLSSYGYKFYTIHGHPNAGKNGHISEHVFVMSEHLGRPIRKGETIHHKNGDKLDNRIENLELWHKGQPAGQRVEDRIKFYIEFLDQYGYDVKKRGE